MNVSFVSLIISQKISSVNCPFYMNELLLQKLCHIVFDYLFCTILILNCLVGLNVDELLVLHFWTRSELFNQIELLQA